MKTGKSNDTMACSYPAYPTGGGGVPSHGTRPSEAGGLHSRVSFRQGLGGKLLFLFLLLSLTPILIVCIVSYKHVQKNLYQHSMDMLVSVSGQKAERLSDYFDRVFADLQFQAGAHETHALLLKLGEAFAETGGTPSGFKASDARRMLEETHGRSFELLCEARGYTDILLFNTEGILLYSLKHHPMLGKPLRTGTPPESPLTPPVNDTLVSGDSVFSDFGADAREGSGFGCVAGVVKAADGKTLGVMVFQLATEPIDRIMVSGMRGQNKCQTYLVGPDFFIRSPLLSISGGDVLNTTGILEKSRLWQANQAAIPMESGSTIYPMIYTDSGSKTLLAVKRDLPVKSYPYSIIAETESSGAFHSLARLRWVLILLSVATVLIVSAGAVVIAVKIVSPLKQMTMWADRVSAGDMNTVEIGAAHEEILELARNFDNVVLTLKEVAGVCDAVSRGNYIRSVKIKGENDTLGRTVNAMLTHLRESAEDSFKKINYLNNVPTPLLVIDREFNVLFVNSSGADFAGRTIIECIGRKCFELYQMDHCNTGDCRARIAMGIRETCYGTTVSRKGGFQIPVHYTSAPLYDENNIVVGSIEYLRDISDEMKIVELAETISTGDYSVTVEMTGAGDRLSKALNRMTMTLRKMTEETQVMDWYKNGQMELAEKMRGESDVSTLSGQIIACLCKYLDSTIGAFYILDEQKKQLTLSGGYALSAAFAKTGPFEIGEGLVGQAVVEKEQILLTGCPDDSIHIESGLGGISPSNILIYPVIHGGEAVGVLELGALHRFDDRKLTFIDSVSQSIAISIKSALASQRLTEMYEMSKKQAEELEAYTKELKASETRLMAQEEKLRASNEQLTVQARELRQSQEMLMAQEEELRKKNEELEARALHLKNQKESITQKNRELSKAKKMIEEKARQFEEANRYKAEFLANMSHELRTPLNSILLLSQLLSEDRYNTLTEKQKEFARTVNASGHELLELINDVLDLTKIETGRMELRISRIRMAEVKEKYETYFNTINGGNRLEFKVIVDPGVPDHIESDPQRFQQILQNLLSNAVKFTRKGSVTLTIGRPDITMDVLANGLNLENSVAFTVRDTGIGIPSDKTHQIFQAFRQVDGTTSREHGGTGLGLSISTKLASMLGGEITLESVEGKGSTFTLFMPETCPVNLSSDDAAGQPEDGSPGVSVTSKAFKDDRDNLTEHDKRLLVMEHSPDFAVVIRDVAREEGFKAIITENGEEGLRYVTQYQADAVILDMGLPGVDGWTVISRLKRNPETRHIPIHIISAENETLDAMKLGAVGIEKKPLALNELKGILARIKRIVTKTSKKLLVIEDQKIQQKLIRKCVGTGDDIDIIEAYSGTEAMKILQTNDVDCIILDLGLPDIPGEEVLETIRNSEHLRNIPVIIYTQKLLSDKERQVLETYSDEIVIKDPASPEKIRSDVSLFLHRTEQNPTGPKERTSDTKAGCFAFSNRTIMLVDDDMRNVYALTGLFEENGVNLVIAKTGGESMEKLKSIPQVELVLLGVSPSGVNGLSTLKEIRNMPEFKTLPIIALTAEPRKGERLKCMEAGANDYMVKPVNTSKLISMMRVWLQ